MTLYDSEGRPLPYQKETSLALKLAKIAGEIGPVDPAGRNDFQNYRFIGYDQLNGLLAPLFAKYGIAIVYSFDELEERDFSEGGKSWTRSVVKGTAIIINSDDGTTQRAGIIGAANDTAGKSASKAETEAVKRFLLKLFLVSSFGDEDPDGNSVPLNSGTGKRPDEIKIDGEQRNSGKNFNAGTMVPGTKFFQGNPNQSPVSAKNGSVISEPQRKRLFAIASVAGIPFTEVEAIAVARGWGSTKNIPRTEYEGICKQIENRRSK